MSKFSVGTTVNTLDKTKESKGVNPFSKMMEAARPSGP